MKKKEIETILYSGVGVVGMLIIILAFNIIVGLMKQRIDLTADKLYTLSDGTKAILGKLDTPIKIRFYCTQSDTDMPVALKTYAKRVEDLLGEYRLNSKGLIEVEKLDPAPDSDAEDSARLDGIEGQPISLGKRVYLGLAISCLDSRQTLYLTPNRDKLLEYDLSRAIARAAHPEKPVLAVLSSLPVFGQPASPIMIRMGIKGDQPPWVFIEELKQDFEVKQLEMPVNKIDDNVKLLVVIYPKDITDETEYAIDQFLLRGGKLVAFLDPLSLAESNNPQMMMTHQPGEGATLGKLLKAWGLEFDSEKVASDKNFTTQLQRGGYEESSSTVLSLTLQGLNQEDALTSQSDNLLMVYSGVFTGTPTEGLKKTVLLKTTSTSQLIEKMLAQIPNGADSSFTASGTEYCLAMRLTGKFKTAFPDGKPDKNKPPENDPKSKTAKPPETKVDSSLKESASETSVVLVGDGDMIYDQVCVQVRNMFGQKIVQPTNGNLAFAQSIVEQLAGDSDLIGVRSRASVGRPFTVVKKMQAQAMENSRSTIKEYESNLQDIQQRLADLEQGKENDQRSIISPEQQAELKKLRQQQIDAKKKLKQVRKNLRQDIDSLENRLKWVNIAGMPFIVILLGISLAIRRQKKITTK